MDGRALGICPEGGWAESRHAFELRPETCRLDAGDVTMSAPVCRPLQWGQKKKENSAEDVCVLEEIAQLLPRGDVWLLLRTESTSEDAGQFRKVFLKESRVRADQEKPDGTYIRPLPDQLGAR